MRCENCPALVNVGGYEYPEYECCIQSEENIRTFRDGTEGCLLPLKSIQKRKEKYEDELDQCYDGISEWYVLKHEIEEDEEMLKRCIDVMQHALGMTGSCSQKHRPYHRHGKLFYRPWRNNFATTRAAADYKAWKKLHFCKLATCNSKDDTPYWEEQDMQEMLYYTVSPTGMKWLQEQLQKQNNEPIFIHGAEKKEK